MIYKKYQHVMKYDENETETKDILNGRVHLFHKIDGTNSCVYLDEHQTLCFGSRRNKLSLENDNRGFMASFMFNPELYNSIKQILLELPKNTVIYGEWLIQITIKTYDKDAWRQFYVFDVVVYPDDIRPDVLSDDAQSRRYETYLPYEVYAPLCEKYGIKYIPVIDVLDDPTIDDVTRRLDMTTFLNNGKRGEGIVIKNYNYKNPFGRQTWAKVLCSDFYNQKSELRSENHKDRIENPVEHKIITKYLNSEFIQKELNKFEEVNGKFEMKNFSKLSNYIFEEFIKDNLFLMLHQSKSLPTINFSILKKLIEKEIKTILGGILC